MTNHAETERTYALDADATLPDLRVGPVAEVVPPVTVEMTTTYHDTADWVLARSGTALRRRTGDDEGWHLKVPVGPDTKLEVRRALGRGRAVPAALRQTVTGLVGTADLVPVADLRTTRTTRTLRDAEGLTLAVVCDDRVVVDRLDGGPAADSWREVEVELVDGDPSLFESLEPVLAGAGIVPSTSGSKIRRALGLDEGTDERHRGTEGLRKKSAGAVVHRYLREQRAALAAADLAHRVEGVSVHDLRVACRRLRAVLAVHRSLLDADRARHVRDELQWLGRELGELRDLEVAREHLVAGIDDDAEALATGPARSSVRRFLAAPEREARTRARAALASDRYASAVAALDDLLVDPGWTDRAALRAARELPRVLKKPRRRLRRAVAAAQASAGQESERAWHHVRKSVKRLRYSLELAEPALPRAERLVTRAKAAQSGLGDHLDRRRVSTLVAHVGREAPSAAAFALGRLHARLEAGAPAEEQAAHDAVVALLKDRRLRRLDRLRG